jgi:hypothetical protein
MIKITRNLSSAGALLAGALMLICSAGTARAQVYDVDTTLDYTGASFTSCYGSYSAGTPTPSTCITPAPFVSGWLTIDGEVDSGWNSYTWPTTVSFSFTDNYLVTLNSSTLYEGSCDGCIQLDYDPTTQTFIAWDIQLTCDSESSGSNNCGADLFGSDIGIIGCTAATTCEDQGDYSDAYAVPDPGGYNTVSGTFTPAGVSTVPEPRSLALFGSGLLLLSGFLRRKFSRR